jgi:hypothetical protein
METYWTCDECGAEVGTGARPPSHCPQCGVRFINGGPGGGPVGGGGSSSGPSGSESLGCLVLFVVVAVGGAVLIGGGTLFIYLIARTAGGSGKRSPARLRTRERERRFTPRFKKPSWSEDD